MILSRDMADYVNNFLESRSIGSLLVGVSGGADSVVLSHLLKRVSKRLLAVHCNFNLRGEESERDALFVADLCESLEIPLKTVGFDTLGYAESKKISVEMAARELRYALFRKLLKEENLQRIAVAHHADDNIETILLNLMRGTGISGLRGMLQDTGEIVRPLLAFSRRQILDYIQENELSYVTDSSNLSSDYKRNFLRNDIIPLLETRWPALRQVLGEEIHIFSEQEKIINHSLENALGENKSRISFASLYNYPSPVSLIHHFLKVNNFEASKAVENEILRLVLSGDRKGGRTWQSSTKTIYTTDSHMIVSDQRASKKGIYIDTDKDTEDFERIFEVKELEIDEKTMKKIRGNKDNAIFYSPLPMTEYIFRNVADGDRMTPFGMKGSRLLSDIMKEGGIPPHLRKSLIVAVHKSTGEIIWLQSLKRSSKFPITPATPKVWALKIKIS